MRQIALMLALMMIAGYAWGTSAGPASLDANTKQLFCNQGNPVSLTTPNATVTAAACSTAALTASDFACGGTGTSGAQLVACDDPRLSDSRQPAGTIACGGCNICVVTQAAVFTATSTGTATGTGTGTASGSRTDTTTASATVSASGTQSTTTTVTATCTRTGDIETVTATGTRTAAVSSTQTQTQTLTLTITTTGTGSATGTGQGTGTISGTATVTATGTGTGSATATGTTTASRTMTLTTTATGTATYTVTPTITGTYTHTGTPTATTTATTTASATGTGTGTTTWTWTYTGTETTSAYSVVNYTQHPTISGTCTATSTATGVLVSAQTINVGGALSTNIDGTWTDFITGSIGASVTSVMLAGQGSFTNANAPSFCKLRVVFDGAQLGADAIVRAALSGDYVHLSVTSAKTFVAGTHTIALQAASVAGSQCTTDVDRASLTIMQYQ